ncbi:hypothetical protein, partial [Bradyrhizobium sp.]|uniref:hypothetical protein n=1 Tax=Bradyrhizobium sp. TaxID=376 RepID=UPI00272F6D99
MAALTLVGPALADREKLSDAWPAGKWIFSFYLPDSYLPNGFYYDPDGRHFIFKTVDPGCNEAHCRRYFIGPHAHCANYSLSAKPGEPTSPVGYGVNVTFAPRSIGDGIQGYWNLGYQSDSSLQSTFVFKIGSCVMGLSAHADEASPKRGNRRFPRPSEDEVLQTYREFHAAFGRYITDRGWTNLETSKRKPDFDHKTPPPGDENNDQVQPPSDTVTALEPPGPADQTQSELTPAEIATVSALAGGTALLGSLLMLGATGVRRDEAMQAIRDLLRGRVPEDPFEAWKRKYEALGWKYSQKNGVATFDPVDGARNEGGEIYSAERGGFVRPVSETPPAPPRLPRDGDVNARGEVWSSFSGGYVERKTYEQDMASRATLADKDRSDLADMQRPDEDVAELNRKIAATRRKGAEMRTYFKARDELLGALGDQRGREGVDALLDESRSGLFDELSDRLLTTPAGNDYRKGLEGLLPLADVIGNQMREGYTPTYTYKDAAQDTLLQSGAAALDAILTKGWASSAVGSSLAMRDAARAGGGVLDIATAGVKAAVTDVLFGKAIHYGAGYAGEAWRAGKNAVASVAESGADLLAQASRRSRVATDLVEKMRKNLGTLDQGVHVDGSGRLRASLTDVLEVQKNPHQVRALKQSGSLSTQEAFNHTLRNEVYKPHDQMLLERLRQSSPELADKKLV